MSGNHSLVGYRRTRTDQLGGGRKGEAGALRSTESEKRAWERGIWRIPHSLQSHPTLLQTQDCVRTSMSRPVTALYLRVPAPNKPLHKILIGVDSGAHEQLTKGDTGGQRETPAQALQRPAPQSLLVWRMEARRMTSIPVHRLPCKPHPSPGESLRAILRNPGDPLRHACTLTGPRHRKRDWNF